MGIPKNTLFLLDSKCLCKQDDTGRFPSAVDVFDTLLDDSGTKPTEKQRQEACYSSDYFDPTGTSLRTQTYFRLLCHAAEK